MGSLEDVAAEIACDTTGSDTLPDWVDHRHFEEIDSTQTYVEREHGSFHPHKLTAVSADFQTNGRGTRERQWQASPGSSVLITFFFRFPAECSTAFVNRNAPNVTKVLAVSTVEALRWAVAEGSGAQSRGVDLGLKWPNDVVAGGRKIAGVLARAVPSPGGRLDGIIVGVGVNVNTPEEDLARIERPVWPATSLRLATGATQAFDVPALRRRLIGTFAAELRAFFAGGFQAFRDHINNLEVLMGTKVRFRINDNEEVSGTFLGVDDDGLIVLRLAAGETRAFPSGEIIPPG